MESPEKDNKLPLQIYKIFQKSSIGSTSRFIPYLVSFTCLLQILIILYFISYTSHVAKNAYVVKTYLYLCIGGVILIKSYLVHFFLMCFS
jgi:hypothetical protein